MKHNPERVYRSQRKLPTCHDDHNLFGLIESSISKKWNCKRRNRSNCLLVSICASVKPPYPWDSFEFHCLVHDVTTPFPWFETLVHTRGALLGGPLLDGTGVHGITRGAAWRLVGDLEQHSTSGEMQQSSSNLQSSCDAFSG